VARVRGLGVAAPVKRRSIIVAVVVAATVVLSACEYAGTGSTRVALFGDSVADDAATETAAEMEADYRYVGRFARAGAIQDQLLPLALQLQADPPDILIVELGVGDAQLWHDDARMRDDIGRVLDAAIDIGCVRWPNLKTAGVNPFYQGVVARSGAFNQVLAEVIAGYPNAEMIDYDIWAQARPGYYLADGLHFNPEGRVAYGNWLRTRVAGSCRRR